MSWVDKFKKGDKVKLTDYSLFSDYKIHKGEIGTVDCISHSKTTIYIRWDDGNFSVIMEKGIAIKYFKTLKELCSATNK